MSQNNSDIDIDDFEFPELMDSILIKQEEPTTPTPSSVPQSKETRKLRKKKNLDVEEKEKPKLKATHPKSTADHVPKKKSVSVKCEVAIETFDGEVGTEKEEEEEDNLEKLDPKEYLESLLNSETLEFTDMQVDDMDTDYLVEEMDRHPLLKSPLARTLNKKKKRSRGTSSRNLAIAKSDIIKKFLNKKVAKAYDPQEVEDLAEEYPDSYWKFDASTSENMISCINADNEIHALPVNISDQGAITGMTLSKDGALLITFSNIGSINVWDIQDDFNRIRHIRDLDETQIDEFYCGQMLSEGLIIAGGKLKNRHRWSAEDNDNHIMPCPIKIFDIITGKCVAKLDGHTEEILCIKAIQFKGDNYLISTSQDGYIIKWHMDKDWITLLDSTPMIDGVTCMAFTVSFVPNTGNKYFLAACDEHLRLYDFEQSILVQTFEDVYSSYCDCGKFINWVDQDESAADIDVVDIEKQVDALAVTENEKKPVSDTPTTPSHAWFISRGAEMCDVSDGVSSIPNSCTLHKLVYPTKSGGKFELQIYKKFTHQNYHANSWLVKITSNGKYILAPTIYGQIFVFNIASGKVSAVIKEHEDIEVRDVIFHPYLPFIFSCSDDGYVKVYTYTLDDEKENVGINA